LPEIRRARTRYVKRDDRRPFLAVRSAFAIRLRRNLIAAVRDGRPEDRDERLLLAVLSPLQSDCAAI
jgi:hypothetical protein